MSNKISQTITPIPGTKKVSNASPSKTVTLTNETNATNVGSLKTNQSSKDLLTKTKEIIDLLSTYPYYPYITTSFVQECCDVSGNKNYSLISNQLTRHLGKQDESEMLLYLNWILETSRKLPQKNTTDVVGVLMNFLSFPVSMEFGSLDEIIDYFDLLTSQLDKLDAKAYGEHCRSISDLDDKTSEFANNLQAKKQQEWDLIVKNVKSLASDSLQIFSQQIKTPAKFYGWYLLMTQMRRQVACAARIGDTHPVYFGDIPKGISYTPIKNQGPYEFIYQTAIANNSMSSTANPVSLKTKYIFDTIELELTNTYLGKNTEHASCLNHPNREVLPVGFEALNALFQKLPTTTDFEDKIRVIAELHWLLIHLMPTARGNSSIAEWIGEALVQQAAGDLKVSTNWEHKPDFIAYSRACQEGNRYGLDDFISYYLQATKLEDSKSNEAEVVGADS